MPVERNLYKSWACNWWKGTALPVHLPTAPTLILNETAIKATGIKNLYWQTVDFSGYYRGNCRRSERFHFQDMHQKILPLLMQYNKYWRGEMYVRTTGKEGPDRIGCRRKGMETKYNG